MSTGARLCFLSLAAAFAAWPDPDARAACNIIPPARPSFQSEQASIDRPFARPGDWMTLALDDACHSAAPDFDMALANNVITVVWNPPGGGARTAVVLRSSCAGFEGSLEQTTCEAALGAGGRAACLPLSLVPPQELEVPNPRTLRFRFPDTDAVLRLCDVGPEAGRPCRTDTECTGGGTCVLGQTDDLTLTGPAKVAVTLAADPLPCAPTCEPGLRACVGDLFADGACAATPHETFRSFTVLPPPNDYQGLCDDPPSVCRADRDDLRFTVDADGNILLPMDWRGILVGDAVPVARLLRASSAVEAFEGRGAPILIPSLASLGSYSPEGVKLPPIFDPQRDPNATADVTVFGSADAPETVLRVARHLTPQKQCVGGANADLPCLANGNCPGGTCAAPRCQGGANDDAACGADAECPGGECGAGLFDFASRIAGGTGPVLLRLGACVGGSNALASCTTNGDCPGGGCGAFAMEALDPVPLEGLNQSEALNAFVMEEAIVGADLNGDDDDTDHVVKLGDRTSGLTESIGEPGWAARAVARVRQRPFGFPALAVEDDLLAFVEPEALQYATLDSNSNGSRFDALLRVFRLGLGQIATGGIPITADAAPVIGGRSVAVSQGRVFFRTREAAAAVQRTVGLTLGSELVGVPPDDRNGSINPDVSADGRFVVFSSSATNLVGSDSNGARDIFLVDRQGGGPVPVSVDENGDELPFESGHPQISRDGRWVVFWSDAPLLASDTNGTRDVYVYDRLQEFPLERVTAGMTVPLTHFPICIEPTISGDGRFVAFATYLTIPGDTNNTGDVFVVDRELDTIEKVSLTHLGAQSNAFSCFSVSISADGRFVAFQSEASNLVPGDTNGQRDVFVRDRCVVAGAPLPGCAPATERVSVSSDETQGNFFSFSCAISADGRDVIFTSSADNLVPGDTNASPCYGSFVCAAHDVFVRDRVAGTTERVSVASDGTQGDLDSFGARLAVNGRYAIFASFATNLVPNDTNGSQDYFVHDRLTGITARLNLGDDDLQSSGPVDDFLIPTMSEDGTAAVFTSIADYRIGGPDTNGIFDVFVRESDPADTAADLADDGDHDDFVLQVLDTQSPSPAPAPIGPAAAVAVAGDRAALITPAGQALLWTAPASLVDLDRQATAIALSDQYLAALVPQGSGSVVDVYSLGDDAWTATGEPGSVLDLSGSLAVFTSGTGAASTLQAWDADAQTPRLFPARPALDFVLGGEVDRELVAFRQPRVGRNDLGFYDRATESVVDTGIAVTPCELEACDPRVPYRVGRDTVTFLTYESEQGTDLNGDGDSGDLVLQVLNARRITETGVMAGSQITLAAASKGVCTTTSASCARDADCAPGACFVPPGGCIRDLGVVCDPDEQDPFGFNPCGGGSCGCAPGQFCAPNANSPGAGTCQVQLAPVCRRDADCQDTGNGGHPSAVCNTSDQDFQRLAAPLTVTDPAESVGAKVFTGTGHCIEDTGVACVGAGDCAAGTFCEDSACRRDHSVCREDSDCPAGLPCRKDLLTQTTNDADADELPDSTDNCPQVANILQEDSDLDGVGDLCDPVSECPVVVDPTAKVELKTRRDTGRLSAKLTIDLAAYAGEPVSVLLHDADTPAIAARLVGAVPPKGTRGTKWSYKARAPGLTRVALVDLSARTPGKFRLKLRAARWFTAAAANESAATTALAVRIGDQCFAHAVTRKTD